MEKIKEKYGSIIMIVAEILIGIIVLFKPEDFTKIVIIGLGIVITLIGIIFLIKYFKSDIIDAIKEKNLFKSLTLITAGLFCIINSNWFIVTFPLLTIIYGIIILITGLMKVQWAIDAIRLKIKKWYITAINAVLSITFAIIIIKNPFTTIAVLWKFIALILILQGILDILQITLSNKVVNKEENNDKEVKEIINVKEKTENKPLNKKEK
ncbi:MAG: DUF308 domain-containing protein [Bacilli bacterium]|nr:DUF308 domain-containing protein [Bacilli bacterium]